ncbi:MAG TPA: BamA/TamA family outer membrane protein, partial [Kofleriaceae bacterium]|nr:BamA/TamA family outer membrane protein [Kofleriaceae bacterium]
CLARWSLGAAPPALAEDEPVPDVPAQPTGEVQPTTREPTRTFSVGAGYSTDDGFAAMTRVAQSDPFGTGKGLALSALLTERRQALLLRYDDPSLLGTSLELRGDLYSVRKQHSGFRREATGGALTLTERIAPGLDAFISYRVEHVDVAPDAPALAIRGVAARAWRGGMVGTMRVGTIYSSVDEQVYPRRGTVIGSALEVADETLGSDIRYLRTDAWFSHHRPLGPLTLHLDGRLSSISDGAPLSERLHFDGSADVRGYAPGAIGPVDPATRHPTGGNLAWTARAELEVPVVRAAGLSVAAFYDAGGVHARCGGETGSSVGFGVIWRSPIGPMRFDFAFPLAGDDRETQFLFGFATF